MKISIENKVLELVEGDITEIAADAVVTLERFADVTVSLKTGPFIMR